MRDEGFMSEKSTVKLPGWMLGDKKMDMIDPDVTTEVEFEDLKCEPLSVKI